MKGDIALAGFVLTAEEWLALDPEARAQLVFAATRREDSWVVAPVLAAGSEPVAPANDDR